MAKKRLVCLEKNLRNEIDEVVFVGGKLTFELIYKMAKEEIQHADWANKSYRKKKYSGQFDDVVVALAQEFLKISKGNAESQIKEYNKYNHSYGNLGQTIRTMQDTIRRATLRRDR